MSVVAVTGARSGPVSAGSVPGRRLSGGDGAAGAARGARPSALPGPGRDILRTRGHQDRLQLPVLIHATATADHRQQHVGFLLIISQLIYIYISSFVLQKRYAAWHMQICEICLGMYYL